jgi:hypothetical protein
MPPAEQALTGEQLEVPADIEAFSHFFFERGWGDGLPLIPPTLDRVQRAVEASGLAPETSLGSLPPDNAVCTVELAAVNAVMAGTRPEAMPLVCAAVRMLAGDLAMFGAATTTNAAAPFFIVNGAERLRLQIAYQNGCMGGATTPANAIGRALRLIMRNVGGELIGVSSKSVFGQPARLIGLVFGEWEEISPWPPYSVRMGHGPDALTGFVTTGTEDVVDISATDGTALARMIGRSLGYPAQAIAISQIGGDIVLALCPPWARLLHATYGSAENTAEAIWAHAFVRRDDFPPSHDDHLERRGLFTPGGDVLAMVSPEHLHLVVCGGEANLHAMALRGFGGERVVTRPLETNP